jgi:hypothetical protein
MVNLKFTKTRDTMKSGLDTHTKTFKSDEIQKIKINADKIIAEAEEEK